MQLTFMAIELYMYFIIVSVFLLIPLINQLLFVLLNIENGYYFISLDPVQTNHSRAVPLAVNNWHPTSFDVYQHCSLARLQPGLHVQIHTINNSKIVLIYIRLDTCA